MSSLARLTAADASAAVKRAKELIQQRRAAASVTV